MYNLKFDRVHRVGTKAAAKVRSIVGKFHYYEQREQVRKLSFDSSGAFKSANRVIGAQLPKAARDARKPLYPKMKEEISIVIRQALMTILNLTNTLMKIFQSCIHVPFRNVPTKTVCLITVTTVYT